MDGDEEGEERGDGNGGGKGWDRARAAVWAEAQRRQVEGGRRAL